MKALLRVFLSPHKPQLAIALGFFDSILVLMLLPSKVRAEQDAALSSKTRNQSPWALEVISSSQELPRCRWFDVSLSEALEEPGKEQCCKPPVQPHATPALSRGVSCDLPPQADCHL